jgi:hypothetical protein
MLEWQRRNAGHVVKTELENLDWAKEQPTLRMLGAVSTRHRVLAVKCGFELTERREMLLERVLQRLGQSTT